MTRKIGKFEVLEKIGEGGFGIIFKGRDPHIKRNVAIKSCTSEDPEVRGRFAQEAQIAGNLHHRHIVTVYDFGEEEGVPYLVQEYLSGEDLDRKVKRREFIPFPEKLLYLLQVARGLEYAHDQGVIHRDIKPANIRILEDGTAKIMDFGIAKLANQDTGLTQTGMTLGTAAYLAPEQIRGEKVDGRTDIFSYGVMAYELLTYRRPFVGQHMSTVLYQILNEEPPPPSQYSPGLPAALDALVMKCLQKDPNRRYDDVPALLHDLDRLLKLRRQGEGTLQQDLETIRERKTQSLTSAGTAPVSIPETADTPSPPAAQPAPPPPSPPTAPPHRPSRFDDLELDSTFDGTRTPHSISATQAIRSRGFAWGRWAATVVVLAGLGLAGWLYYRQSTAAAAEPSSAPDPTATETAVETPDQTAPNEAAADDQSSEALPVDSETETAAEGGDEASPDQVAEEQAPPAEPPPPAEGMLVIPAAWNPRIQVVIGESAPLQLDRERRVSLPPGTYPLEFSLYGGDYSDSRSIEATVRSGQDTSIRVPVLPPAILRVQPTPSSPADAGFVFLNSRNLGPTGTTIEHRIPPGRYTLKIYRELGDEQPAISKPIELKSRQRLVASFSYRTNDVIVNSSPVRDR